MRTLEWTCGLDLGTTHLKAVFLAEDGRVLGPAICPTPETAWRGVRAHDPEILWQGVRRLMAELGRRLPSSDRVCGVAVASVAEEGVLVDARGQPLAPVPAWFNPLPSAALVELAEEREAFYLRTGLRDPAVSGLAHLLGLREGAGPLLDAARHYLTLDAYVAFRLSGVARLALSQASRTGVFHPLQRTWDEELLGRAGRDPSLFPPLASEGEVCGGVRRELLPLAWAEDAQVAVGGHDHVVGAIGAGVTGPERVLDSLGTAESLARPVALAELPDPALRVSVAAVGQGAMATAGIPTGRAIARLVERWQLPGPEALPWGEAQALAGEVAAADDLGEVSGRDLEDVFARLGVGKEPRGEDLAKVVATAVRVAARHLHALAQLDPRPFAITVIGGSVGNEPYLRLRERLLGQSLWVAEGAEHVALGAARLAWQGVARARGTAPPDLPFPRLRRPAP